MNRTRTQRLLAAALLVGGTLYLSGAAVAQGAAAPHLETTTTLPGRSDAAARRQDATAPGTLLRPAGGSQWTFYYGLGLNQTIANSAEGIHIASGGVRWTHLWSQKFGGILRGNPGFGIEFVPVTAFITEEHTTWAFGTNIMYEHHFAASGVILPVWRIGAGAMYANNPIPEGETKFNFTLLMDVGVDLAISDSDAMFVGYRFHHVSNANIGDVNPGINVHTIVFGLTLYR